MDKRQVSPGKGDKAIKGASMRGLPPFTPEFNATGPSDELHRMHFTVVPLKDGEPGVSIHLIPHLSDCGLLLETSNHGIARQPCT